MLTAVPLMTLLVLMLIVLRTRGDGRRDLCRCPKCSYAMDGHTDLRCPECGYQSHAESELYQPRGNPLVFRASIAAILAVAAGWAWMEWQVPWTQKVPRFALRFALGIVEPYQGVPTSNAEIAARAPTPNQEYSSEVWERLIWRKQVNNNLRQWVDATMSMSSPLSAEELPFLVPLAIQANKCYTLTGSLSTHEAWLSESLKKQVVNIRDKASDPAMQMRAEWVLAELQQDGLYWPRIDFAVIPNQVIDMCLRHQDADVRLYGLSRVTRAVNLDIVTNDASGMTVDMNLLKQIAQQDPHPRVQQCARDLLAYMKSLKIK